MKRLIAPLVPLLLAGCTVGPDHARPAVAGETASWIGPAALGDAEPGWWRRIDDPMLAELIAAAAARNLDVREAEARLREARAERDAAAGRALPTLSAASSASRNQISENGQFPAGRIPGFERRFDLFDGGFDASWEIDLWGGNRRSVEAAQARSEAAEAARREVRLATVAEVVRAYAELRGGQARVAAIAAEAEAQAGVARLTAQRERAGESSVLERARADVAAASARAAIAPAQAEADAAAFRLALLTGQPPEALIERLRAPSVQPMLPPDIPAGLRADVLRRRPDVARAERDLAAATADVGVATAELFPRFSLIGAVGQQSRSVSGLGSGGSTRFSIGPQLHWPLFEGGRIRAQIRAADARADAAVVRYERAVLGALTDSETALNRHAAARAARIEAEAALARSRVALGLAEQRYRAGEDGAIAWLDAQAAHARAERSAADARTAELTALAALGKALGGELE